ncbi:MAG: hypothetical protein ACREUF_14495 [Solimonas sp.]
MKRELVVLFAIVAGSTAAEAQTAGEPRACERTGAPLSQDYDRENAKEWPQEAQRFKGNEQDVSRQGDRLRLALDGGKALELTDCPYGDRAYRYLYERYDEAGRFYVIRTQASEDFSYTLVKRSGRSFTVHGAPVWASDKSRFLTVACSLLPPRGNLVIQAPSGDDLVTEAEIALPCETESCSARWDFQSWISVACTPRDTGRRGTEFVVMRGNDGAWRKFGR